ncbi:cyclic nucleotide-binding domain-containing protein, partial [candidate division KSB1 bacterium]
KDNSKNGSELTRFPIFSALNPLEAMIIDRSIYRRKYKKGEVIVKERDASVGLYLINSGEVKVYKEIKGIQIELATLQEGSFFGELTLLEERPRSATIQASDRTEVLCLFRPDFLEILKHHPIICSKFLPNFCSTIIDRTKFMYKSIDKLNPGM